MIPNVSTLDYDVFLFLKGCVKIAPMTGAMQKFIQLFDDNKYPALESEAEDGSGVQMHHV